MEFISTQYEDMCRACMSRNSANSNENTIQLQSIFYYVDDCENRKIRICELLNKTVLELPKIEVEDALPKYLCSQCLEKLCSFYEFQNSCIITDLRLRQLIEAKCIDKDLSDPLQSDIGEMQEFIKEEEELCESDKVIHALQRKVSVISDNYEVDEKSKSDIDETEEFFTSETKDNSKLNNRIIKDNLTKEPIEYSNKNLNSNGAYVINEADGNENENESDGSKIVGNKRIWSCENCEATFTYKTNLWYHMKRTHNIDTSKIIKQQWVCDICKHYFLHYRNFQSHQKKVHNIETENNKRDAVQDSFTSELNMEQTSAVETVIFTNTNHNNKSSNVEKSNQSKKQRYGCDICTKTFTEKRNLQRHVKTIHKIDTKTRAPTQIVQISDAFSTSKVIINNENEVNDIIEQSKEIAPTQIVQISDAFSTSKVIINNENEVNDIIEQNKEIANKAPSKLISGINEPNSLSTFPSSENAFSITTESQESNEKTTKKGSTDEKEPTSDNVKIKFWTCKICQGMFCYKRNLKRHMNQIHHVYVPSDAKEEIPESSEAPVFKCNECDRVYFRFSSLKAHKERHLRPVLKSCQICNKTFKKLQNLRDHERKHTDERAYLCAHCGKTFSSRANLSQHVLRHNNEKRYVCSHCPKPFSASSDLRKHVRQVHETIKPFVCDICNAAFKRPYLLKVHKWIHTGNKRFQCEYCDKRFSVGEHHRRHTRTHTGEKPLKCQYCARSFNSPSDLRKHYRIHLGENIYQCEFCPSTFRLDRELRVHFASHKNDDEETKHRNKLAWLEAQEQLKLKLSKELK